MKHPLAPISLLIVLLIAGSRCVKATSAAPGPATKSASASASSQQLLLTEDLLDRMIAVARQGSKMEQAQASADDIDSGDDTAAASSDSTPARLDSEAAMRALLARNGFTKKSYLLAMTTLAHAGAKARMAGTRWASKVPGAASVDPRNVRFYNRHAAKISTLIALINPDYSPQEDARTVQAIRSIDPDNFDDCVLLVPSVLSLAPHATAGSSASTPSQRIELAKSTAGLAAHFHSESLKKDFGTIAAEVRRNAHAARLESPAFVAALAHARDWANSHCRADRR